jgi:hypothetical protein
MFMKKLKSIECIEDRFMTLLVPLSPYWGKIPILAYVGITNLERYSISRLICFFFCFVDIFYLFLYVFLWHT